MLEWLDWLSLEVHWCQQRFVMTLPVGIVGNFCQCIGVSLWRGSLVSAHSCQGISCEDLLCISFSALVFRFEGVLWNILCRSTTPHFWRRDWVRHLDLSDEEYYYYNVLISSSVGGVLQWKLCELIAGKTENFKQTNLICQKNSDQESLGILNWLAL